MGQYFYLIAGLPELHLDDQKLKLSLLDFKQELNEHLSKNDRHVLSYFFRQFDNENLLKFINKDEDLNPLGELSLDDFQEIMLLFKESDSPVYPGLYEYFKAFVPARQNEEALLPGMRWDDQLSTLYYEDAMRCKNELISEWFSFNLNVNNILTAVNCLKHGYDREKMIIGNDELAQQIRTSNARDFNIAAEFPEVEEILKIAGESDIYERERKIDFLKWNWLEEKGFFHYFDVEHLFIYLVRMHLLSRWVKLEKESGLTIFREMIERLQGSFEFPNEFTVKKVVNT